MFGDTEHIHRLMELLIDATLYTRSIGPKLLLQGTTTATPCRIHIVTDMLSSTFICSHCDTALTYEQLDMPVFVCLYHADETTNLHLCHITMFLGQFMVPDNCVRDTKHLGSIMTIQREIKYTRYSRKDHVDIRSKNGSGFCSCSFYELTQNPFTFVVGGL